VRERPRILEELYEEFHKFSRAEVLHFCKLGQQRKSTNKSESSRSFKFSKGKEGTSSFDTLHSQVHSVDSDGCGPLENWEKNFRPPRTESKNRHMILEKTEAKLEVATQIEVMVGVKRKTGPSTTCSTKETLTIRQETPIFLESKKRMTQRHSQPSTACIAKDVNHTSH
jgi:hypothetical protein